ncbi:MAG: NADH-quinone oxidoreductase subunit NuoG [Vulcanimicrobiota bacterium]
MSDLVNIVMDGQAMAVPKGTLLVEAAREIGIEIPVYCYHPKLKPVGACRVCAVYVENQRRPIMTACTTTVMEGMVVHTRNSEAIQAREGVLEFLLINHPLDCPVCDRGGECDLQDFTMRYGPPTTRFVEAKRHFEKSKVIGRNVVLDRERCIMCQRCVRFCSEVAEDENGLVIIERGARSEIGTFEGRSFDSQFSGNTIEICPVGALTSRTYRFKARPWELQHFEGVCTHCSLGCNLTVDVRFDEVARFRSRCNDAIDDGWLCDRGRYGFGGVTAENRLLTPLVRRDGELKQATWDEALEVAAAGLEKANKVGAVAGPALSNEGAFTLAGLIRGGFSSGHLDHRRGPAYDGRPVPTGRIQALDKASAIVLLGCDPTATHPVLDLRIKKGVNAGASLVVIHPGQAGLERFARVILRGEVAEIGDQLAQGRQGHTPAEPEALRRPCPRPWEPGGRHSDSLDEALETLAVSNRVVVVVHEDSPVEVFQAAERLVASCGCEGEFGLLVLGCGANSQGLKEMGVLPHLGPGLVELKEAVFEPWGDYSKAEGKSYQELVEAKLDALIVVEDDCLAGTKKKSDFLVVLSVHANATTEQADVVLPVCHWLEQTQTFTNSDRMVQLSRQAVAPAGESRPAWQALASLGRVMGKGPELASARAVYALIGRHNPLYQGASYRDFTGPAGHHWSYPQQGKLGTPRPDLSAIPVSSPDAPPWIATEATGSRVERVARILSGDQPPAVPGQHDPRQVARLFGLEAPQSELEPAEAAYVPLRVIQGQSVQPPGPSPAIRYHRFGVGPKTTDRMPAPAVELEAEAAAEEVGS